MLRTHWPLWLCYGGMISVAITVNLAPVYLTTFAAVFGGLDEEQLGRIPAVIFAGGVVGILVCGPLADRLGARLFAVLGLVGSALGLFVMALSPGYGALLLAGGLMGLGTGAVDMILSPIVSALAPERRGAALNKLHAYYCVGAVGTVVITSCGLWLGVSWRVVTAVLALAPALLALGFLRVELPPLVMPGKIREGLRILLLRPRFFLAMAAMVLAGGTEAGMVQWLPAYAERVLGYGKAASGLALAAFSVAMMAGRMLASNQLERFPAHGLMVLAGAACTGLFVAAVYAPVPGIALAACILVGFTVSVLWPTNLAITADRIPLGGASMFALLAAAGNFGNLVTPWAEGVIAERSGLPMALLAASLCPALLVLCVAACWVLDRGHGQGTQVS